MPHSPLASASDHVHIRTIDHHESPVTVWFDTRPDMRSVMVAFEHHDEYVYIPAGVAGAVADAIRSAVAPDAARCDPARCTDAA